MTGKLTLQQQRALAALMAGASHEEAALAGGCSPRTLRRWRSSPAFAAAERRARGEALSRAMSKLSTLAARAAEVLGELADDGEAGPMIRLGAARAVIDLALKARDADLEARLTAIEEGLASGARMEATQ